MEFLLFSASLYKNISSVERAILREEPFRAVIRRSYEIYTGIVARAPAAALLPVVIIILVSFAMYFSALFHDFVYDDIFQVTEDQLITDMRYIPAIFTESVWGFQT